MLDRFNLSGSEGPLNEFSEQLAATENAAVITTNVPVLLVLIDDGSVTKQKVEMKISLHLLLTPTRNTLHL